MRDLKAAHSLSFLIVLFVLGYSGCGGGSSGRPPLMPPAGVTAVADAPAQVTVDWVPDPRIDSYKIHWATTPGVSPMTGTLIDPVTPPYTHTGLTSGTTYYYIVTARKGSRESLPSAEVSATPLDLVGGVTATGGTGEVTIDWLPVTGAASYNLYWSTTSGVTITSGTQVPGVTAPVVQTGLTNGTTYYYVVTAVSGATETAESNEASALPLEAPTGVAVTVASATSLRISWNSVPGASGYDIYWETYPGVTKAWGIRIAGVTSPHVHTGLLTGGGYYYVVVAWNTVGGGAESVESSEVYGVPAHVPSWDPTLGGSGYVVHDLGGDDAGRGVVIDAAGRIIVAGYSMGAGGFDMTIWRTLDDGTLDPAFNGQGWVTHHDAAGGGGADMAQGVALDSAGRIVTVGYSLGVGGDDDLAVWRYLPDGTPDASFGTGGVATDHDAAGGGSHDRGLGIALDPADAILVTGESLNPTDGDMAVWKYDAAGALDPGFGASGRFTHDDAAGGGSHDAGRAIAIDTSGRVVVAGHSYSASDLDMVLWRLTPGGTLDGTYGAGGIALHSIVPGSGAHDYGIGLTLTVNDRAIVAGYTVASGRDMAIWKTWEDGTPMASFGTGGYATHHDAAGGLGADTGWAVTEDWAGQILVAGHSLNPSGNQDMVIWRYEATGQIDTAFGAGGVAVHDNAAGGLGDDFGRGIVFDGSGRILVAGSSMNASGNEDVAIWRWR